MPQKEVEYNGVFYWELEQKDECQVFPEFPKVLAWENENDIAFVGTEIVLCLGKKECSKMRPFISKDGWRFRHAALLSSEHKKESRRCTNFELAKWCAKGNGYFIDRWTNIFHRLDLPQKTKNEICNDSVVSICTWDGEPMEPTAENMGLEK